MPTIDQKGKVGMHSGPHDLSYDDGRGGASNANEPIATQVPVTEPPIARQFPQNRRAEVERIIKRLLSRKQGRVLIWDLQAEIDLRTLALWSGGWLPKSHANGTLTVLQERGQFTPEEFALAHAEYTMRWEANQKEGEFDWTVLIPSNIARMPTSRTYPSFTMLGQRMRAVGTRSIEKYVGKINPQTLNAITQHHADQVPPSWISLQTKASNPGRAWSNVAPAFATLIGILEFVCDSGSPWLTTRGTLLRYHGVRYPTYFMVYGGEHRPDCFTLSEPAGDFAPFTIPPEKMREARTWCRILSRPSENSSLLTLTAECLALYGRSINQRTFANVFIGLWQLAEALTLSENFGGDTRKVCERFSVLAADSGLETPGLRELLCGFAEKRNDLVHRGREFAAGEEDVQLLKFLCRHAITRIRLLSTKLPTRSHLENYYGCACINDLRLTARYDAARYVLESRGKGKARRPQ